MQNKALRYLLLLVTVCCFSSCFQIIEEINISGNGSGTVDLTVNLSASKAKVASIMLLDSINGYKVPTRQTIQKEMDELVIHLKNSRGISNVKKKIDFQNYIVSVSFAFENVSNINNINQSVLKKLKINTANNSSYLYNTANNTFQRNYTHTKEAIIQYNKLKPEVRNIFKEATYTSIYRFEKPIVTAENPLAKISKTRKAILLNTDILGLINGKTNISNKITLSK
ncbi:hypothetical protein HDF26_001556 [Pedobacter cryoconitis]|uniref:hypothetical protein n=1 Tax=Pedobacter cryoconitis TaxID=188932 RepID=UPI00161DB745|nr:hypothetical protein [Pedobacter cryoconitis]MBB6271129.1 hypothetical protein [Pedobacter cryoconitis]